MAFVALAQSLGRASEAAAVLHLACTKEEAALVTMMLDVRSFITLACEAVERRYLNHLVKRNTHHRGSQHSHLRLEDHQPQQLRLQQSKYMGGRQHQHENLESKHSNLPESSPSANKLFGVESIDINGPIEIGDRATSGGRRIKQGEHDKPFLHGDHVIMNPESPGSHIAPTILPPLVGLVHGTPPTPNTLKTVLATSTSVAVDIPTGFGLAQGDLANGVAQQPAVGEVNPGVTR